MDPKKNENLFKIYLSTFESFKKNVSKKDKYYKEIKESYAVLKETLAADFNSIETLKKFSMILVFALETSNLKLIEKSLLTIDYIISHELIDSQILDEMVKNMLTHLYGKSMLNDDNINYKILNLCIIIYSSKLISINGVNLINIIKVCLNIFLSSKNPNCQNMAKLTLIQIIDNMINKLEIVFSLANAHSYGYNINKMLSKSLTPKNNTLHGFQLNPSNPTNYNSNNINVQSNVVQTDENSANASHKEFYREENLSGEYNIIISKYMNYYLDLIEIDSLTNKNSNTNEESIIKKYSQVLIKSETQNESQYTTELIKIFDCLRLEDSELKNEAELKSGKFGWCINCRNQANFFSERINFPICSNECEVEVFRLHKLIDIDITVDSTNYRDDYINTLKILSKLSIKESRQQNYIEQLNLKLREFCLELIQTLIQKGAKFLLNENKLIQVIKESTMDSLVKNTLSNEMNIFKLSLNLFLTIISNFREHLKDEIEIFINRVLIAILESENLGYLYKEIILDSLMKLAENCNFLVEIYINYDCDINHKSVFYDLINLMTKIIQGMYKKQKYATTFKPLQEANLRIKCLDFLTVFIRNLSQIVDGNNKNSNLANSNNTSTIQNTIRLGISPILPNMNDVTQNDIYVMDDDLNTSIFGYDASSLVDLKDKINQNLKMKGILAKAIDKFNINPSACFNFFKSQDCLPSESNFENLKEKLINSQMTNSFAHKEKPVPGEENVIEMVSDVKSVNSGENYVILKSDKEKESTSAMLNSNFYYNYVYIMSNMDLQQLQALTYQDFYAREISRFVKSNLKEINKLSLGNFICGSKPLNKTVLEHFIESYNFKNFHVFEAMRMLLSDFTLTGESQIVDRVMQMFGQKYHKDNPNVFKTPDVAYYIGFSIMMLNTDLHRDEVDNKMPLKKFISNLYLLCSKDDIDESYIVDVYYRVQNNPLIIPGQKINIHGKNKKDLIKMEKESILKSTFEELQNKTLISNNYITIIDNDHIKNLLEASWSNFHGIFSQLLADFDEESIVNTCIDNILLIARMCGVLRLDTIAEAFINTILSMANIMEAREIKQKNLDCTKGLVDFAVQSGVYIRTCWFNILNIISKIDYYHTIGGQFKNEAENFAKEIRRRSKLKNPEKEIEIEFKNTDIICKNISIIFCDNIFSKSAMFDEEGIVNFVQALCKVSRNELELFFNPRNYSLHKLVEVADFNIFRVQIEWAKIWKLISDHLVYVATHYNHDNICIDAIDSLRQTVIKLLQKPDLAVYNFQIDFFKPFEIIFNQSINRPDRSELILTCIAYIVQNSKNIHSGWIIIFSILKNGLKRKDAKLNSEIQKILHTISEDFSMFNNINQEVFRGYIECLCHMYLEENLKKLAFETILKLMSKIFSNLSHSNSQNNSGFIDKKFEFLKIFFYGFDDLLRINVIEHLNLLFEVISYNKDVIFSSDIHSFIYVFYCYFKPHIVTLLLYYFDYRLSNFQTSKSELHSNDANISIFKHFMTKNSTDDIYHNSKYYLEDSLNNLIEIIEKTEGIDTQNDEKLKCSPEDSSCTLNNFFVSKNGGSESKKMISNFLKNIMKCYDKDSDLIIKKIDILKNFELENYEMALEFFLEKFLIMINKVSDSYMNYKFFYEDLLTTLLQLSLFNKYPDIVFKIIGKNILSVGNSLSPYCWKIINSQIVFLLQSFASIKTNISEANLNNLLTFLSSFSIFYKDIILNFYGNISLFNHLMLDEYKLLNIIFFKLLSIDIENEFEEYKIIESYQTLEILKTFAKTKFIILEKSPEKQLVDYYDNSTILSLEYMSKVFEKYKLREEEKNDIIDIIEFELEQLLPKFLKFINEEELETIFNNLMDLIDSKNSQLRFAAKFLLKQFTANKLITFNKAK